MGREWLQQMFDHLVARDCAAALEMVDKAIANLLMGPEHPRCPSCGEVLERVPCPTCHGHPHCQWGRDDE